MNRFLLLCLSIFCSFILKAQSNAQPANIAGDSSLRIYTKVEIESEFPGGTKGWNKFLGHKLAYPEDAINKKIQGMVVARFIVQDDGSLSNIEIVSGPPELWSAVIDVLNKSPNWVPAMQGGKKVKSYKTQPFIFKL